MRGRVDSSDRATVTGSRTAPVICSAGLAGAAGRLNGLNGPPKRGNPPAFRRLGGSRVMLPDLRLPCLGPALRQRRRGTQENRRIANSTATTPQIRMTRRALASNRRPALVAGTKAAWSATPSGRTGK